MISISSSAPRLTSRSPDFSAALTAVGAGLVYLAATGWYLTAADVWLILLDVFILVMFGTAYLMLLRRYAGGKHFSSNGACFAFSVFTLVPVPMVGFHVQLPFVIQLGSVLLEATLFLVYSPAKVRLAISEKDRKIRKRKTLSIYVCGLCFAYFLGGEGYVNAMLLIGLIAAFAVVEKRQRH